MGEGCHWGWASKFLVPFLVCSASWLCFKMWALSGSCSLPLTTSAPPSGTIIPLKHKPQISLSFLLWVILITVFYHNRKVAKRTMSIACVFALKKKTTSRMTLHPSLGPRFLRVPSNGVTSSWGLDLGPAGFSLYPRVAYSANTVSSCRYAGSFVTWLSFSEGLVQ